MAKRKRLTPARLDGSSSLASAPAAGLTAGLSPRPPIADVAHDAAASAALSEVAQTLSDARTEGRLIQPLPLDLIDADYLVRDRMGVAPDEMTALKESLRARGQQTAIEVTALDTGRYGLISGWRRLQALREISIEESKTDSVLAIVRTPEDAAAAYLAMVEENEIRVGLSYYERARIVARAVDRGVYARDRVALAALFHAASRPKRSKIGTFVQIVRALDDHLAHPTAMTERTGLMLAQALAADTKVLPRVIAALTPPAPTAQAETTAIMAALKNESPTPSKSAKPDVQTLPNGMRVTMAATGQLTLQGALLRDDKFRARLLAWLAAN